jgi:hypothetical protein
MYIPTHRWSNIGIETRPTWITTVVTLSNIVSVIRWWWYVNHTSRCVPNKVIQCFFRSERSNSMLIIWLQCCTLSKVYIWTHSRMGERFHIVHDRFGYSSDPSLGEHLHYPNDLDGPLIEVDPDKIRQYHTDSMVRVCMSRWRCVCVSFGHNDVSEYFRQINNSLNVVFP